MGDLMNINSEVSLRINLHFFIELNNNYEENR